MPELPEVETVTNSIKKHLIGKSFDSISTPWLKTLYNFSKTDFDSKIKNKKIINIYRRAKFIVFNFDDCIMTVHLRMTGKLYVVPELDSDAKHISAILAFEDKFLIFEDTRKFGRFYLYENLDCLNDKLGPEPLSDGFSEDWLYKSLQSRSRQMKSLLLDQSFISGLGNIYVDESLWHAKIHPLRKSDKVTRHESRKLVFAIKTVLSNSIKQGGTTIRDYTYDYSYVGNYALNLKVYGRNNFKCERCQSIIIKYKVAQRGTYVCPECQKV